MRAGHRAGATASSPPGNIQLLVPFGREFPPCAFQGQARPSRVASVVLLAGIGILLVPGLRSARGDQLDASRWDAKVDPLAAPLRTPTTKSFSIAFPANFGNGGRDDVSGGPESVRRDWQKFL